MIRTIKETTLSRTNYFTAITTRNAPSTVKRTDLSFYNGHAYAGDLKYSLTQGQIPHGKGAAIWTNSSYTGEWQYGKRHGLGIITFDDGGFYIGEWQYDKRHGQGSAKWANGDSYAGEWFNGWPGTHLKDKKIVPIHDLKSPSRLNQILNIFNLTKKGVIFQATADHNGAFQPHKENCQKISQALKAGMFDVKFQLFSTKGDLENEIKALPSNVSLVWLRAHGNGKSFDCGSGELSDIKTLSLLEKKLAPEPIIILESCKTGEKGQLGEELRDYLREKYFKPTVIAPEGNSAFTGLNIKELESGKIDITMLSRSSENIARRFC